MNWIKARQKEWAERLHDACVRKDKWMVRALALHHMLVKAGYPNIAKHLIEGEKDPLIHMLTGDGCHLPELAEESTLNP